MKNVANAGEPEAERADRARQKALAHYLARDRGPGETRKLTSRIAESRTSLSYTGETGGNYYFPPLPAGKYNVWAQALGFETAKGDVKRFRGRSFGTIVVEIILPVPEPVDVRDRVRASARPAPVLGGVGRLPRPVLEPLGIELDAAGVAHAVALLRCDGRAGGV
jgi:hypothetical protein